MKSKILEKLLERLPNAEKQRIGNYLQRFYEENYLYSKIIDELPYAILILDDENHVKFKNKLAENFLDNMQPIKFDQRFDKLNEFLNTILSKKSCEITCRIEIKDENETVYLKWQSIPIFLNSKEKYDYLIILIMDITDEIKREQKLLHTEKLALVGTLSAGIAHELRNPLSTIFIHIEILFKVLNNLNIESKKEIMEILNIIYDELKRINQITNDFMKIAKPLKISLVKTNLIKLIEDVIRDFNILLKEKNIKLEFIYDNIDEVYVDPKGIFQAIYNLIKNSIEAIDKDGKIIIRLYKSEKFICIDIIDNGKGIEEENIDKVFEPYFTTKKSGTGLGLMNVYNIIHAHQGKITVKSKKGMGTKFTIFLPIRKTSYSYVPLTDK